MSYATETTAKEDQVLNEIETALSETGLFDSLETLLNRLVKKIEDAEQSCADLEAEADEAAPRLAKLDALEAAGVDSWDGYDAAMSTVSKG